jgi:heptaprenyl diphosphate synthase
MRNKKMWRVTLTGVLFALAIGLSFLENMIAPLLGLPPGVKLGLANVAVMYALYFLSGYEALILVVLKAGFSMLTRGAAAGLLSLAGGLVSLGVMLLLTRVVAKMASVLVVSIAGALGLNLGQFVVVWLLLGPSFVVYAPVLLVSGVVVGSLTASLLRALLPALQKSGLMPKDKTPPQ